MLGPERAIHLENLPSLIRFSIGQRSELRGRTSPYQALTTARAARPEGTYPMSTEIPRTHCNK